MGNRILQFDKYKKVEPVNGQGYIIDTNNSGSYYKKEEFNPDKYDELVATHDYDGALAYARSYVPNDPKERANRNALLDIEERKFRILKQRFKECPDDSYRDAMEFNQAVFTDGGLDQVGKANPNNIYYTALKEQKSRIGGVKATKLSITFNPAKRTFLGLDFLAPDNDNTFEAFVQESGMSANYLRSVEGIEVNENAKDGTVTLTFDKSHALSNKILASMPTNNLFTAGYKIKGLDDEGNSYETELIFGDGDKIAKSDFNTSTAASALGITDWKTLPMSVLEKIPPFSNPLNITNQGLSKYLYASSKGTDYGLIKAFKQNIESAKNKQNDLEYVNEDKEFNAPAIKGPLIDDQIEELNYLLDNGMINQSEYNKRLSKETQWVYDVLAKPDLSQLEVYSDFDKLRKGEVGTPFELISDEQANQLLSFINAGTRSRTHINTVTFNGKVGLAITIDAIPTKDKDISKATDAADLTASTPVTMYIAGNGLGSINDVIEKKLNQNSLTKSMLALSDMKIHNISYTTLDGQEFYYNTEADGVESYVSNGKLYSREDVMRELNKDISIRAISQQMPFNHLNAKGEIINEQLYDDRIKTYAYQIANEYYPNTAITDEEGNILSPNDVYGLIKTLGLEEFIDLENTDAGIKIRAIKDIYDQLREALYQYDYSKYKD